jgi:DNA invertase Pin-like site-specific DNA recombinase
MSSEKIGPQHRARKAMLYVRQSSPYQVLHNRESQALQYAMRDRLAQLGWSEIEVVDEDLGRSAASGAPRAGFERMVAEVCLGKVGAVAALEVSRFARNSRDWQQLVEMCRVVDTLLIDQETVYAPRYGNDRLLLGLKGSLNEYELDLLRQRSLAARYEKARRGELVVSAPVGFVKVGDRLEKDRRVQDAIRLVIDKVAELGSRPCCGFSSTRSTCRPGAPAEASSGSAHGTQPFTRSSSILPMAAPMPTARPRRTHATTS